MEMFAYPSKLSFNIEESNNESPKKLDFEIIMGNNNSIDSMHTKKATETDPSDEKTVPVFSELETNNLSLDFINERLDFLEKNFTKVEASSINSFENRIYNQDFLQTTWSFSIPSDNHVNDNDIEAEIILSESFKNNATNSKSIISKKDVDKEHCRKYREKNKKNRKKSEQELAKKIYLNGRLKKRIFLLNDLIELFKCICSFRTI